MVITTRTERKTVLFMALLDSWQPWRSGAPTTRPESLQEVTAYSENRGGSSVVTALISR